MRESAHGGPWSVGHKTSAKPRPNGRALWRWAIVTLVVGLGMSGVAHGDETGGTAEAHQAGGESECPSWSRQGTAEGDRLKGSGGRDLIDGLAGDDWIKGFTGNDLICGNADDDVVIGGDGDDRLFGGSGNDSMSGGEGNDRLYGGDGDDTLLGGPGRDLIDGGPGYDICHAGPGDEVRNCESDGSDDDGEPEPDPSPPIAVDDTLRIDEDAPGTVSLIANDFHPDGRSFSVTAIDEVGNADGTVADLDDGSIAYDPGNEYQWLAVGDWIPDSFDYTITDTEGLTASATITVTIDGRNDAPFAFDDVGTTNEKTPVTVDVLANDWDYDWSDTLHVDSVSREDVTINDDGTITFDPSGNHDDLDTGQSVTETFTYTVADNHGATGWASVAITIDGVTDGGAPPDAVDDTDTVAEGATKTLDVLANDVDSAGLGLTIDAVDTSGTAGSVTMPQPDTIQYAAGAAFDHLPIGTNATDTFTYTIRDAAGNTDTATVTVTVTGTNDWPVAGSDAAELVEYECGFETCSGVTSVTIDVLANDSDPDDGEDPAFWYWVDGDYGDVSLNNRDNTLLYTPLGTMPELSKGETLTDTFTYRIRDSHNAAATGTVMVTIVGQGTAVDDTTTTTEDDPVTVDVLANDTEPGATIAAIDDSASIGSVALAAGMVTYDPSGVLDHLAPGDVVEDAFRYEVIDAEGGRSVGDVTVTVTGLNDAPWANADRYDTGNLTVLSIPAAGLLDNDRDAEGATGLTVGGADATSSQGAAVAVAGDGSFTYDPTLVLGGLERGQVVLDTFDYTVSDGTDGAVGTVTVFVRGAGTAGPRAPDVFSSSSFIYTGPDAPQTGVAPDAIVADRANALRGAVRDTTGAGVPGAEVTILGHPEYGSGATDEFGIFDLVVNGGGPLTVQVDHPDFLPVQRRVEPEWNSYFSLPDPIVLTELDGSVSAIDLTSDEPVQVHRATPSIDEDGFRQATLAFPSGTTAEMTLPDGSTAPLTSLDVRATEYTVGPDGPDAMPGDLPPTSGYTYAVELSVDQALAAGATDVSFSQPIQLYVDNFIDFPVGQAVPLGYYDRTLGKWIPADDGRVIEILDIVGGKAVIDAHGTGTAPNQSQLDAQAAMGITDVERTLLAQLYSPGDTLWRSNIDHFTPWDCNWPFGPPRDGEIPDEDRRDRGEDDGDDDDDDEKCKKKGGSFVGCLDQSLQEHVPIAGTPYSLVYSSRFSAGRQVERELLVRLTPDTGLDDRVIAVHLQIDVAGQHHEFEYPPTGGLLAEFTWNGLDRYGTPVNGTVDAQIRIGYQYEPVYYEPGGGGFGQAFASYAAAGASVTGSRSTGEIIVWRSWTQGLTNNATGTAIEGMGGWTIDTLHRLTRDFEAAGSGQIRPVNLDRSRTADQVFSSSAIGTQCPDPSCSDPIAVGSVNLRIDALAIGPDGSVYMTDSCQGRVWKTDPERETMVALRSTTASNGCSSSGYNRPDIAVGPDGSTYYLWSLDRLQRIGPDGVETTIAGGGTLDLDDTTIASEADLTIRGFDVGPDGTVYLAVNHSVADPTVRDDRVLRLTDTGHLESILTWGGGPIRDVVVADDGRVFAWNHYTIYEILPDGSNRRVAGVPWGAPGANPDRNTNVRPAIDDVLGGIDDRLYFHEGELYFFSGMNIENSSSVRRTVLAVDPDANETRFVAGGGDVIIGAEAVHPWRFRLGFGAMDFGPDGSLFIADSGGSRLGVISQRALTAPAALTGVDKLIPNRAGTLVRAYDGDGKQLYTFDRGTGAMLETFTYDAQGRLTSIADAEGDTTVVERDADGVATVVVAPTGERTELTVNAQGLLETVRDPLGQTSSATYHPNTLLASFTDRAGDTSSFVYDDVGRVTRDESADGRVVTLDRQVTVDGFSVTVTENGEATEVYEHRLTADGGIRRTTTSSSGQTSTWERTPDGITTKVDVDGTVTTVEMGPDPEFAQLAPIPVEIRHQTAAGESVTTYTREVTPAASGLGLDALTDTAVMDGRTVVRAWDGATRSLTLTSPGGGVARTVFDEFGRIVEYTPDSASTPVTYTYDTAGKVATISQGTDTATFTYDSQGRLVAVDDPSGSSLAWTYDANGRPITRGDGEGNTIEFSYDGVGNIIGVQLPAGNSWTLGRNESDDLTSAIGPGGASFSWVYDDYRNLASTTMADGSTIVHTRDVATRLTTVDAGDSVTTFSYDGADRRPSSIARAADGVTEGLAMQFDGLLPSSQQQTGTSSASFTYAWDVLGQLTNIGLTSGSDSVSIPITRDDDLYPVAVGPFAFTRDGPGGGATTITDGTATFTATFDALGHPAGQQLEVGGATAYSSSWIVDADERITQRTQTVAGVSVVDDYSYDLSGSLVTATRAGVTTTFSYDPNGNRTGVDTDGVETAATYDERDLLESFGATAYTFDANGFLTGRGTDSFVHGTRGELLEATVGGTTATYRYDGLGRRVARGDADGTYQYLYGNPYDQVEITAVRDPSGTLTTYFYDDADRVIALERGGSRFYVATDQLGSPRVVVDATGAVVRTIDYDAFGGVIADDAPDFELAIGFAGGIQDPLTGFVRFGLRDYDPVTGRWITTDPALFRGGPNLHAYVGNDPVNLRDTSGLYSLDANAYAGVGGGVKLSITSNGLSLCSSIGFGVGGGVGVSPVGGLDESSLGFEAQAKAEAGPASIGIGGEHGAYLEGPQTDDCGRKSRKFTKGKFEGELLGLKADFLEPENSGFTEALFGDESPDFGHAKIKGLKTQANASMKLCGKLNW